MGGIKLKNNRTLFDLSLEDKLLLCCSRTKVNPEIRDKIHSYINEDLDWQYLAQMASIHRLTPLLYHNLNSFCSDVIPEDFLHKLKDHFNLNVRKNLMMTGELIKILDILNYNKIDAIPYKGPLLADLAYGNLSFREFDDIDILINKSDALTVKRLMLSEGYLLELPVKITDSLYLNMDSEYRFFNENNNVKSEINWNFEGIFFSFPFDPNFLFEDLITFKFNGFNTNIFSPVNHLIIMCIHGAKHDWNRLSWICDISEFINSNKNINWDEVLEKAKKIGVKKLLFVNLFLAIDLFQLNLPNNILNELELDSNALKITKDVEKRLLIEKKPLNLFGKFIFDIKKRDKLFYGIKDSVFGLIKPSYADFQILPLPEYLFYLYYIIRPFLLLKRYR